MVFWRTLSSDTGFFSAANVAVSIGIDRSSRWDGIALLPVLAPDITLTLPKSDAVRTWRTLENLFERADYALRKQTVEPVFGIIKHVMKFRQFLLRGVEKVRHEWNLVAIAWNMKRMRALKRA